MFQADLNDKLMAGVESEDFKDKACNCNKTSLVDGVCVFGGGCRKCVLVYDARCKFCEVQGQVKSYLGNTQQQVKTRTNQHLQEVVKLIKTGQGADSFASHFAEHFVNDEEKLKEFLKVEEVKATVGNVRKMVKMEVLWQGNPIKCMKSFGKRTCVLCMKERLEMLKRSKENPEQLINSRGEIYGACRHKTKFHRFKSSNTKASTDDGAKPERVSVQSHDFDARVKKPPPGDLRACQVIGLNARRARI